MNEEGAIVEDQHAIACHEAGHLIAARFCERAIDKVSLDRINGKRGCFYKIASKEKWTIFDEMLTLLAGPRAQVELCPDSIGPEKLAAFRASIIQPEDNPREIPAIYHYTAWEHDVRPVYQMLTRPDWPAPGLDIGVTVRSVYQEVEKRLLAFFADRAAIAAASEIAARLLDARLLDGGDAEALVKSTGILESEELQDLMAWR